MPLLASLVFIFSTLPRTCRTRLWLIIQSILCKWVVMEPASLRDDNDDDATEDDDDDDDDDKLPTS